MTDYFVGPGGNDGNDGLTWAQRFLTLNGAEDEPVAAGDVVYVAPGVYRETLTCDVSGGSTYSTGTVSVTNGSDQVTGNGTTFGGNVEADYYFHVRYYDQGTDGITDGTSAFAATAGNFHANLIGCSIQINTLGAYTIAAVADADNLTLADPNALGWPGATAGLTYSIMSGEGHYEIESQDDNTTLTLVQPWQGKTHSGLAYLTFDAIKYIADVTGENTDDVGGVVRITGSDNDQTAARSQAINVNGDSYRTFRGFSLDTTSGDLLYISANSYLLIEGCVLMHGIGCIDIDNVTITTTIRRSVIMHGGTTPIFIDTDDTDDTNILFENCLIMMGGSYTLRIDDTGGVFIKNCIISGSEYGVRVVSAPTVGQCVTIYNTVIVSNDTGLAAQAAGQIIEDYNTFYGNGTNRSLVGVGSNSVLYSPIFQPPILHAGTDQLSGYKFPWTFGELSEWSQIAAIAGVDERNTDLFGIARPATAAKNSWGPVQFADAERETTTTRGASTASITLHDAGRHHIWVPVSNTSTTISVYVYREANYAGANPQLIIKQPGQADDITTDAAAASQWNELTTTLTPAADPPYVVVELVSNNTAAAGDYDIFFDDLTVT